MPASPVTAPIFILRKAAEETETPGSPRREGMFLRSRGHANGLCRRDFFAALPTMAWMASPSEAGALAGARGIVCSGAIGFVTYCRASEPRWVAAARQVCGDSALIVDLDATTSGAVLLGSTATLVLERTGFRVVP